MRGFVVVLGILISFVLLKVVIETTRTPDTVVVAVPPPVTAAITPAATIEQPAPPPVVEVVARQPAPIADYALSPYTRAGYPKAFAAWGAKGIKKIERLRKIAADHAALSAECDSVDVVEFSDRSVPPDSVVIWVDCANQRRFYFSEAELKASGDVVSETQKGQRVTAAQANDSCIAAFKAGGRFVPSFPFEFYSSAPRFVAQNGRWVVEVKTPDADRVKGAPAWARCIIIPDQPIVVDYADF